MVCLIQGRPRAGSFSSHVYHCRGTGITSHARSYLFGHLLLCLRRNFLAWSGLLGWPLHWPKGAAMKRASRELALRNGGIAFKRARPETVKQQHAKLEVVDVAQRAMNPATGPAPSSRQYAVPPSIHFVFG